MFENGLYFISLVTIAALAPAIFAASENFGPEVTFQGSTLTGWYKLGDADWSADHGEILGTPKPASRTSGGRL